MQHNPQQTRDQPPQPQPRRLMQHSFVPLYDDDDDDDDDEDNMENNNESEQGKARH